MNRGGHRQGAGRKSTWGSGAKFEDTTLLRVPKNIKDELLDIAHKLDVGEKFDIETKLKLEEKILDQEIKIQELSTNSDLLYDLLQKQRLELETKSNLLHNKLIEIESIKCNYEEVKNANLELVTKLNEVSNQIKNSSSTVNKRVVTKSKKFKEETVTKSKNHTQLGLLNSVPSCLKPLNSVELSQRFGKYNKFVVHKKMNYKDKIKEFADALKKYDPDGIAWLYSEEDKKYHPIFEED